MPWQWLDSPAQWDAVVKACYAKKQVGLDTETYGHNVKTSTPAHRAKIDVWSLALATTQFSPRGYHRARACVLPLDAALYPPMKEMLESQDVLHIFHNAHHDMHSFANYGISVGAVYDTLDAVRFLWPSLDGGYYLKPVRVNLLGKPAREGFTELTAPIDEQYTVLKEGKLCACMVEGCRKTEKKWGEVHAKRVVMEEVVKTRKVPCPIESIVPGHPRWERKLDYAGDDAADGLELYEVIQARLDYLNNRLPPLPWEWPMDQHETPRV